MTTDVIMAASSGQQDFPEMFDFSTAQFSASAFDSEALPPPPDDENNTGNEVVDDVKPFSALGDRNDSENHDGSEELTAEWVSFGGAASGRKSSGDEFFAGLENARLILKVEDEESAKKLQEKRKCKEADGEKPEGGTDDTKTAITTTTTGKLPRLKRCETDTPSAAPPPAPSKGAHPKGPHRGRKPPGADDAPPKTRKSTSPKRSPSRRAVSPKRNTLRRTTSAGGGGDDKSDVGASSSTKRATTWRRATSGGDEDGNNKDSPHHHATKQRHTLRRTTSAGNNDERGRKTDLSRIKSSHNKKKGGGSGVSVVSAPPTSASVGGRRHLGRSHSAKVGRGDRSERSLSPRRIVSSRKITDTASSDPEITSLLDEEDDDDDDDGDNKDKNNLLSNATTKKRPTAVRSISTSSADDKVKKRSSSPTATSSSTIPKPKMSGRAKSSGERGKHGRTHSPSSSGADKRSSSPSVHVAKPHHLSNRIKSTGERSKRDSSSITSLKKRASSPSNSLEPADSSSLSTKLTEKKKRASCPSVFSEDEDESDSDESLEVAPMEKDNANDKKGRTSIEGKGDKGAEKKDETTVEKMESEILDDGSSGELTIDIDEKSYTSVVDVAETNTKDMNDMENEDSDDAQGGDAKEDKDKSKKALADASENDNKSRKRDTNRSKERSPSRGIGRSRSMPRDPSGREISRSHSRLGRSDRSQNSNKTRLEKSPSRDIKRAPTSMREVMSLELTKSAAAAANNTNNNSKETTTDAAPAARGLGRTTPSSREVSKSPPRELKRGAVSARDVSSRSSPSRGLIRSDASTREVARPTGLAKAHSTKLGSSSDHNKEQHLPKRKGLAKAHSMKMSNEEGAASATGKEQKKRAASPSPSRRAPQRATSEKVSRPPTRRGLSSRTVSSRSPTRDTSRRRLRDESDRLRDNSSGRLDSSSHHGGSRLRDASDRHGRMNDGSNDAIPRNTARGRLESKRMPRRLRKEEAEMTENLQSDDAPPPATEPQKSNSNNATTKLPARGPGMRRTLSGPGPRGARGRGTLGNIQQRQLLGGLEATEHQKDDDDELLDDSSSCHNPTSNSAFPDEEIGDLFAAATWHNRTDTAEAADPTLSPRANKLSAVTSVFKGRAKSIFGLNGSHHGGSPNSEGQDKDKDKNKRKFRTSIFGGKGGKAIKGPSMLSLDSGTGDDLDSSSDEFAF